MNSSPQQEPLEHSLSLKKKRQTNFITSLVMNQLTGYYLASC